MGIKAAVGLSVMVWLAAGGSHAQNKQDAQDNWANDGAQQLDTDPDDTDPGDADDDAPKPDAGKGKRDVPKQDTANKDKGTAKGSGNKKQKPGGCVDVTTQARFAAVGYDHIVVLTSACKKVMKCTVKTDVNPEPSVVELAPGAQERVVTWRGSPARVFTPDVTCE